MDEADDPFERAYGDLNRDEQAAADLLGMADHTRGKGLALSKLNSRCSLCVIKNSLFHFLCVFTKSGPARRWLERRHG